MNLLLCFLIFTLFETCFSSKSYLIVSDSCEIEEEKDEFCDFDHCNIDQGFLTMIETSLEIANLPPYWDCPIHYQNLTELQRIDSFPKNKYDRIVLYLSAD